MKTCCGGVQHWSRGPLRDESWKRPGINTFGQTVYRRFNKKVLRTRCCWIWTAAKDPSGYGAFNIGGNIARAHTVSVRLSGRDVGAGMETDHICFNPSCANPRHLEVVTPRENNLRGSSGAAVNARKTVCLNGHAFDENNTYFRTERRPTYPGHRTRSQVRVNRVQVSTGSTDMNKQAKLFEQKIDLIQVNSVIGSGYEKQVADLAIRDKVAYRAARKNMQIHSAIILKLDDVFSGFFTYQVNHEVGEFCLLQSAMELGREDKEVYKLMLLEIIKQNTYGYPMVMTVSTKHMLECPKVLSSVGFKTYLELSGYEYMVYGTFDQVRMKRLAHATMTNTWNSTKADWLRMKREWNEKLEAAGEKHGIKNPKYASRDGCWQGTNGMANVVLATQHIAEDGEIVDKRDKSLNGNASVLDPVACEVILRFFMPKDGRRVYNPFGGGVQMGFVAGSYGYDYISSEIRKNQCDANNAICQDLNSAKWVQSDSSKYTPDGKFDLCFSCPPYYQVEEYLDYDGKPPAGELNSIPTYAEFRDTLFTGYKKAIEAMNDNCFFVVMTGDSRDKNGAYYGCEAEHELFFRDQGLHIYNKVVYLECEFTRLAHAKVTLNYRKFPKREQKVLVFYKGDISAISKLYPKIGRL